uniref:Uncharacterized protein n=1 Tax=Panagrolaimus davidi TaxID=227884 RepID=A0A914QLB3_9BILA
MASQYNNGGSYDQNRGGQGGGYPQHNRYGGEQRNRYGGGGRDNNGGRGGRGGRGGNQGGWEPFQVPCLINSPGRYGGYRWAL